MLLKRRLSKRGKEASHETNTITRIARSLLIGL
jgi:hypothetical protein